MQTAKRKEICSFTYESSQFIRILKSLRARAEDTYFNKFHFHHQSLNVMML